MINDIQYNTLINSIFGNNTSISNSSFEEVDKNNKARENEEDEEEMDVWNDGSELSIEDFKATGEDLDDYEDGFEFEGIADEDFTFPKDENLALNEDRKSKKNNEDQLDNTDAEGVPLNEKNDLSGKDLDVPGAELDDEDEEIGEEDEENNEYSQSKQDD